MMIWVLIISLHMKSTLAFATHEGCEDAIAKLKVPATCVAFAADVPTDGKKL